MYNKRHDIMQMQKPIVNLRFIILYVFKHNMNQKYLSIQISYNIISLWRCWKKLS